jgi:hypothetical protein
MKKLFNGKWQREIKKSIFNKFQYFNLFVKTQNTPNPHFIKFLPGRQILEEGETYDFSNIKQAINSPLALKLFDVYKL